MTRLIPLLALLFASSAYSASVVDAWGGTGSGTSVNVAITVPAGDDQLLCVAVLHDAATASTPTVTFNGDPVVEVEASSGTGQFLWTGCLVAPDQTTANVAVSGVSIDRAVAVVLLEDVDQVSPYGTAGLVETAAAGSLATAGVATASGGIVLSFASVNNISGSQIASTGSGQTDIAGTELGTGSYALKAAEQASTGSSVVSSFSWPGTPRASVIAFHVAGSSGGGSDTTPDAFSFTDQTSVSLSSTITSAAVTITGIDATIECTATGGTIDLNADGNFQATQDVDNNDQIRARHTSSGSYSTAVNTVVDCNGVSDTFTSTTEAESVSPALSKIIQQM